MGFVRNLPGFPTVKEFWKFVENWRSYHREFGVRLFWGTVYYMYVWNEHQDVISDTGYKQQRCLCGQLLYYTTAAFYIRFLSFCIYVKTVAIFASWSNFLLAAFLCIFISSFAYQVENIIGPTSLDWRLRKNWMVGLMCVCLSAIGLVASLCSARRLIVRTSIRQTGRTCHALHCLWLCVIT